MASYPIWNKIQACIYKAPKSYGVKSDGTNEILVVKILIALLIQG